MDLKNLQKKVDIIFKNLKHPKLAGCIALVEEVGELAREIMDYEIYEQTKTKQKIQSEIADVFITLVDLCNIYQIDLEKITEEKINDLTHRIPKWEKDLSLVLQQKRKKLD